MPNLRGIPGKPWRPMQVQVIIIIIILRMRMRRSVTDIYIYIYTHRESLVRNHEPCAKALGNNYKHTRYTHQRRCLAQTIATKGSCMPNLRGIHHGDPLHVQVIIIIILRMRSACAEA